MKWLYERGNHVINENIEQLKYFPYNRPDDCQAATCVPEVF